MHPVHKPPVPSARWRRGIRLIRLQWRADTDTNIEEGRGGLTASDDAAAMFRLVRDEGQGGGAVIPALAERHRSIAGPGGWAEQVVGLLRRSPILNS